MEANNIKAIIAKASAPLIFCAKDSFKRLQNVKDLETTIPYYLREIRANIDNRLLSTFEKKIIDAEKLFVKFNKVGVVQQKTTIVDTIEMLSRIMDAVSSKCEQFLTNATISQTLKTNDAKDPICMPIQFVKGVGPRISALFAKKKILNVEDIFYFLPRCYEDRTKIKNISDIIIGEKATIMGTVVSAGFLPHRRRRFFEVILKDEKSSLKISWFQGNATYLEKIFVIGKRFIVTGKIGGFGYFKTMSHPDFEIVDEEEVIDMLHFKRIVPIYSETEGLQTKSVRKIMMSVVDNYAHFLVEAIPEHIRTKRNLLPIETAFRNVHFPPNNADLDKLNRMISDYHKRIVYDEFFFLQLGMALRKKTQLIERGISFSVDDNLIENFYISLPFTPTGAQKRVINEIVSDMKNGFAMHRLFQGDVGSGKTIVAIVAMLIACNNGYQATIMAPTELLARQHFANVEAFTNALGIKTILLTGSQSATEKTETLEQIKNGQAQIIIGTHAVFQDKVSFYNLGLAVIDEQHRFGVAQRMALKNKGVSPDILIMTATPIPRTLAMSVYGDMDISIIDELPPHKKHIRTKVFFESQRQKVYEIIRKEVERGNQVFVVYPLVEESESIPLLDA
ncbi:MAG: ATP-dependent DNA helicase RecG, partial [Deltaproteobacteria bacterium]